MGAIRESIFPWVRPARSVNEPFIDPRVLDETSNRAGRAKAMTLLTPLWPIVGAPFVRAVFLWVRSSSMGTPSIKELSFIHFARWGVVRRMPSYGQPREHLLIRPLFMFESNYNGSFDAYIDAFAQIVGRGMAFFWGTSAGFPGPLPVGPFKTYIRVNEFVTEHYYSAYPEASATMVLWASRTERSIQRLLANPGLTTEAFDAQFTQLLDHLPPEDAGEGGSLFTSVAKTVVGAVDGVLNVENRAYLARNGQSYYFVSLVPILPDRAGDLEAVISALDGASPFASLAQVHFARFVILDQVKHGWPGDSRQPPRLKSKYLLFTAALTGVDCDDAAALPGSFLDAFSAAHPETADAIWHHCYGYEGSTADPQLRSYLTRSQVGSVLFYVGCDRPVAEVVQALEVKASLEAFAADHETSTPAERRAAFSAEAPGW